MNIGIIGGGASGMMLASLIKTKDKVTLIDANAKLGKKLLLTGNGKCNFTADDFTDLHNIYNNDFARAIYKRYDRDSFLSFMKNIGIEPKLEWHKGRGYYYPNSNKSTSVYYALLDKIKANGVNIVYNAKVINIESDNNKKTSDNDKNATNYIVETETDRYVFDKIVIATGGMSYKNTGSDGSVYKILEILKHRVVKPLPGLVGFAHNDHDLKGLKGVRVDAKVIATIYDKDSKILKEYIETGEVQFNENYISGIPMMDMSRYINRYIDDGYKVELRLNLYNREDLYDYLVKRRENLYYKKAQDFLCGLLPDELANVIIKRTQNEMHNDTSNRRGELCEPEVENLTNGFLKSLVKYITNFKIGNISLGNFDNAQVTLGGVDINEVNVDTLESKIYKGMYFTGEVLDIDGRCGGYNLQLAYSTAVLVSHSLM
ncbi:MAG: aminoacetone oxidase family FAD-binding enzyme [Lachnospiraceae bacterium]|nr:aminoacetone oxidase family FAD-binding enzyme [Lachnospiraceae bacterium]